MFSGYFVVGLNILAALVEMLFVAPGTSGMAKLFNSSLILVNILAALVVLKQIKKIKNKG